MKLSEQDWTLIKKEIENIEYGRIIIFCSPKSDTLDISVEHRLKLPVKTEYKNNTSAKNKMNRPLDKKYNAV
jgi:hypothetical protein